MHVRRYRPYVIAAVAVVVAALLTGGQSLLFAQQVGSPVAEALEALPEVHDHHLERHADSLVLTVELGPVANLYHTHRRIADRLAERLERPVRIVVHDARHPQLEAIWYAIHHQLMDAELSGGYGALAGRLADMESRGQLDVARLYLDRDAVYVQLMDDQGYLYMVLTRAPAQSGES